MKTQLLCTFSSIETVDESIQLIRDIYDLVYNYIYVLQSGYYDEELYITYNINKEIKYTHSISNTILIHRKKETNTLYTINSLNRLIVEENGVLDKKYKLNWEDYKNSIILLNGDELNIIPTKLYNIIEL